jgi:maleate isomerase
VAHEDNWGWRARIGIFIVGNECVPEAEWWAMAPKGVSIHAARVTAKSPWAQLKPGGTEVDLAEDLARGAKQFSTMRLNAAVFAHTTSSVVGGKGWDAATAATLAGVIGNNTFCTTNGQDTMAALKAMNVKRPFLVLPPWFPPSAVKAAVAYYTDHGFTLSGHMSYDPGPGWRDIPPSELYANGMGFEQQIEPLYAQIRAACPAGADGVLMGGTGFRCVGIIEALEQDLKRPVISANQASLWHSLRKSGVNEPIEGFGKLLRSQAGA